MAEEQKRRAVCPETEEVNPFPMMSALRRMRARHGLPVQQPVRMDQSTANFLEKLGYKILSDEIKLDEEGR